MKVKPRYIITSQIRGHQPEPMQGHGYGSVKEARHGLHRIRAKARANRNVIGMGEPTDTSLSVHIRGGMFITYTITRPQ